MVPVLTDLTSTQIACAGARIARSKRGIFAPGIFASGIKRNGRVDTVGGLCIWWR